MAIEQVPDIPMFRQNTAAFIHELPAGCLSNVDGESSYVRVQVLTNAGALDRGKQLAVVEQLTSIVAAAAGDPSLTSRTWVLLTEAPDGGWGLAGHANTNEELVLAARAQIAALQAGDRNIRHPYRKGTIDMDARPNIVLVHGAWADGSSWSGVIERLQAAGYHVAAPQFPMTALADDVARLRQVLDFQDGPTVVAGHSYGGQIMTALGTDAPNVAGLVYIAAFGLDQGESLGALLSQGPPTPALAHTVHR